MFREVVLLSIEFFIPALGEMFIRKIGTWVTFDTSFIRFKEKE